MRSKLFAIMLGLAGLLTGASAQAAITLRTAGQDSAPVKFDPVNAEEPGICIEILRALEQVDPELKFSGQETVMPLARILASLENGQLDVFLGAIRTPEREAKYGFIEPMLFPVRHRVAVRILDTVVVNSYDDIRKLAPDNVVLVPAGTAYQTTLEKGGLSVDAGGRTRDANLKKLMQGRGRFVYDADINLLDAINKYKLRDQVRLLPAVFKEEGQYLITAKTVPPKLRDRLAAALKRLQSSGELARIYARYAPE